MPKMTKALASKTNAAETQSFEPLDEGKYPLALRGVEVKEGAKAPYWSWEFEVADVEGFEETKGRRLWVNTSTSEKALWKMKETFEAFGVDATTDTDELIGEIVLGVVSQRAIEGGSRKGEIGNNVDTLLPWDGEVAGTSEADDGADGMFDDDDD